MMMVDPWEFVVVRTTSEVEPAGVDEDEYIMAYRNAPQLSAAFPTQPVLHSPMPTITVEGVATPHMHSLPEGNGQMYNI